MKNIIVYSVFVGLFVYLLFLLRAELHIMQQNSYYNARYIKWLRSNFWGRLAVVRTLFKQKTKIKLNFTSRAIRLFACAMLLTGLLAYIPILLKADWRLSMFVLVICTLGSFTVILLANGCMMPIEKLIANWYVNDAKKKLKKHDGLIKIAITGSYGKTSVAKLL